MNSRRNFGTSPPLSCSQAACPANPCTISIASESPLKFRRLLDCPHLSRNFEELSRISTPANGVLDTVNQLATRNFCELSKPLKIVVTVCTGLPLYNSNSPLPPLDNRTSFH